MIRSMVLSDYYIKNELTKIFGTYISGSFLPNTINYRLISRTVLLNDYKLTCSDNYVHLNHTYFLCPTGRFLQDALAYCYMFDSELVIRILSRMIYLINHEYNLTDASTECQAIMSAIWQKKICLVGMDPYDGYILVPTSAEPVYTHSLEHYYKKKIYGGLGPWD